MQEKTKLTQQANAQSPVASQWEMLSPIGTVGADNDAFFGAGFQFNNVVIGLSGNDTINTIFGRNDRIEGGRGDDSAITGAGDDQIDGGAGSEFVLAGPGNDIINGGAGNDLLNGDDFRTEDLGNDQIQAGAGNDYVDAGGGNDVAFGGSGFDRITGGEGADLLFGEGGSDVLTGADGDDIVYGGEGDDAVLGFADNDQVYGDNGNDIISGGAGNDLVFGGAGNDTLIGFDIFVAPQPLSIPGEVDILTGGTGNDTFVLGGELPGGVQALFYTDGNPTSAGLSDYALITDFSLSKDKIQLIGSASDYSFSASPTGLPSGTAIFLNDGSTPELIGIVEGIEPDHLNLTNATQFTFLPPPSTAKSMLAPIATIGADNDGFFGAGFGIDNIVVAGTGNDTINTIFGRNDRIEGGSGDDSAITGGGDDIIDGGSGSDLVLAGSGNDVIDGGAGNDFLNGDDNGDAPGNDQIQGGTGNDFIDAGGGNDVVFGGSGFDRISGQEGADLLFGDDGDDVLTGAEGDDIAYGGEGDDAVLGFANNDQVFGDSGNDIVSGGSGNDLVFGGFGNDTLIGFDIFSPQALVLLGEVDTLTGNQGRDTFVLAGTLPGSAQSVFYTASGNDDYALLADFKVSEDKIQLIGSASDYTLGTSPTGSLAGTGIFLNNGSTSELIGFVAGVSTEQLSLTNTNQFTFV
ncbi:MAG: hypothetical protein KME12_25295 [Trichocoleus desertorum ATA4-8-CV12]|nr:hypothetical protein [Trichocoleus desertorum ATA4-8-CV12]